MLDVPQPNWQEIKIIHYCRSYCRSLIPDITTISYYNHKPFYLRFTSQVSSYHWLHVSRGRTNYSNDVIWLHSRDGFPSSGDGSPILSAWDAVRNTKQNRISSETHNWDVDATWEIEPKNVGFTQMTSQGGVKGQIFRLSWFLCVFLWNNLWSVCRYITGQITGCLSQDGTVNNIKQLPVVENVCQESVIDHQLTFLVGLLSITHFTQIRQSSLLRDCLSKMWQAW